MSAVQLWHRHLVAAFVIALLPALALAHGLLLDADSDGNSIFGTAYYTNGERAVNESIALLDLSTQGSKPIDGKTDADGNFRFDAVASHRYRVTVFGDEGHSVKVELDAKVDTRPEFIDDETATQARSKSPPAWAGVGSLLLLSLVVVAVRRLRRRQQLGRRRSR